jgi:hypothetical protein
MKSLRELAKAIKKSRGQQKVSKEPNHKMTKTTTGGRKRKTLT